MRPRSEIKIDILNTSQISYTYLWEPLLVPARANDKSYQLTLLKPTQWQLRALTQEVKHLIQGKWTLSRHRYKCCGGEKNQFMQWVMSRDWWWWKNEKNVQLQVKLTLKNSKDSTKIAVYFFSNDTVCFFKHTEIQSNSSIHLITHFV